jgi:RecJ-like exonuclease
MKLKALERMQYEIQVKQTFLRSVYNPATALGDKNIIGILREIEDLVSLRDSSLECENCKGTGFVECNCNCPHCEGEYECEDCGGVGKLEEHLLAR